jgi:hypothetical protein
MELRGALAELGGQTAVDDQARLVLDVVLGRRISSSLVCHCERTERAGYVCMDLRYDAGACRCCYCAGRFVPGSRRVSISSIFLPVDPHTTRSQS